MSRIWALAIIGLIGCGRFGLVDNAFSVAVSVESATPATGSIFGGEQVTLSGRNFDTDARVLFDGIEVEATRVSQEVLTVVTPPHASGAVEVSVELPDGRSGACATCFTFAPPPIRIDTISPATGPVAGGTEVLISGVEFPGDLEVYFDDVKAQVLQVERGQVLVQSPPHDHGPVTVIVRSADDPSSEAALGPAGFSYFRPDLRFADRQQLAGGAAHEILTSDLNQDGLDDLIVIRPQDAAAGAELVAQVRFGLGSAQLGAPVETRFTLGASASPGVVEPCDWDGDGTDDLLIGARETGDLFLLTARSSGELDAPQRLIESGVHMWADQRSPLRCGDVNGDGVTDLVNAEDGCLREGTCAGFSVHYGDGAGGVASTSAVGAGDMEHGFAVGYEVADFDEDGHADIALVTLDGEWPDTYNRLRLYRRADLAAPIVTDMVLEGPHGVTSPTLLGDYNCDGHLDLAMTGEQVYLVSGDGQGGFAETARTAQGVQQLQPLRLRASERSTMFGFTGTSAAPAGYTYVFLVGCGQPYPEGEERAPAVEEWFTIMSSFHVAAIDQVHTAVTLFVNDDNVPEIALGSDSGVELIFSGTNGPEGGAPWWSGSPSCSVTFADIDGDGRDELIGTDGYTTDTSRAGVVSILRSTDDGFELWRELRIEAPGDPDYYLWVAGLMTGDLNSDGRLDLLIGLSPRDSSGEWELAALLGQGGGEFSAPVFTTGPFVWFLDDLLHCAFEMHARWELEQRKPGLCDFDGDGHPDLVDASGYSPGDGDGHFGAPVQFDNLEQVLPELADYHTGWLLADSDGDHVCELIYAADDRVGAAAYEAGVGLRLIGELAYTPTDASSALERIRRAADVNGDGRDDLLLTVGDYERDVYVMTGLERGGFEAPTLAARSVGFADQLLLADVNGDALTDIVATSDINYEWRSPIELHVIVSDGNRGYAPQPVELLNAGGSLFSGDFNGDGLADFYSARQYESGGGHMNPAAWLYAPSRMVFLNESR